LINVSSLIFLQFANGTPRTECGANQAGRKAADCGKIGIAKQTSSNKYHAVLWSLAYRSSPAKMAYRTVSLRVTRRNPAQALDSTISLTHTLKHPMSPLACPRASIWNARKRFGKIWAARAFDSSAVYGYSLGDWNETWISCAECRRRRMEKTARIPCRGAADLLGDSCEERRRA